MLSEILIAVGLFIGFLGGFLLRLKVGMPTAEKRREAVNKLIKRGTKQENAEKKIDTISKILRNLYYAIMAIGALLALIFGIIIALNQEGGA